MALGSRYGWGKKGAVRIDMVFFLKLVLVMF